MFRLIPSQCHRLQNLDLGLPHYWPWPAVAVVAAEVQRHSHIHQNNRQ
jgi:hypothetical protein